MHYYAMPDVFGIPPPVGDKRLPWFAALALTAIVIGATLALILPGDAPSQAPQVNVVH
jgi:hypothetical protein